MVIDDIKDLNLKSKIITTFAYFQQSLFQEWLFQADSLLLGVVVG